MPVIDLLLFQASGAPRAPTGDRPAENSANYKQSFFRIENNR
jgi:hypothetical protein